MKALSIAAALALFAAPAVAADAPPKAPDQKAADKPAKSEPKKEDKLICSRETDTGSFLSKRVCKTQAQIDAEKRQADRWEDERQQLSNNPNIGAR